MRLRRILLTSLTIPALALVAATAVWFYATYRLDDGLRQFLANARANGWTVNAAAAERGGWPLAATLTLPGIAVSGGDAAVPVPLAWGAERLTLRVALFAPRRLVVAAVGAERLRLGSGPELPLFGDSVRLIVPLAGPAGAAELQAVNLRVGRPGTTTPDDGLSLSSLRAHGAAAAGGFGFDFDVVTIGLPTAYPWLFGPRIAALSAAGLLHGPFPAAGSAPMSPAQAATAWRDGGGTLELHALSLDWGPLKLDATGTLGLDPELQPIGSATLHLPDYAGVLDALARAGRIAPPAAMAAKAVLGLMARGTDQEGQSVAELPVRLQDRSLTLGRIPLARMPQIVWPAE